MAAKGQTKYKDTMPAQLIEMFSRGKDRCHFCAHHSIAEQTFSDWIARYPEFAEAYETAKAKAKTWWLDEAQDHLVEHYEGSKLNTTLWSMIMRNRFELTEHRKLRVKGLEKAKTAMQQMKVVMSELGAGNLTAAEAASLTKLIESGVNIYEATELEKRVSEIEMANKLGAADGEFTEEPSS